MALPASTVAYDLLVEGHFRHVVVLRALFCLPDVVYTALSNTNWSTLGPKTYCDA